MTKQDEGLKACLEAEKLLVECGCCGCLHPKDFWGDCRDDDNRYGDVEEYLERHPPQVTSS